MKGFKPAFQQKLQKDNSNVKLVSEVKISPDNKFSNVSVSADSSVPSNINENSVIKVSSLDKVVSDAKPNVLRVNPQSDKTQVEPLKVSSVVKQEPLKVSRQATIPGVVPQAVVTTSPAPLKVTPQVNSKPVSLKPSNLTTSVEPQQIALKPYLKSVIPAAGVNIDTAEKLEPSVSLTENSSSTPTVEGGLKLSVGTSSPKNKIIVNQTVGLKQNVEEQERDSAPMAVTPLSVTPSTPDLRVAQNVTNKNSSFDDKLKAYFTNTANEITLGETLQTAGHVPENLTTNISNKILHTNHSFDHITPRNFIGEVYKADTNLVPAIIDHLVETTNTPYYDLSLFDITPDTQVSLNTAHKLGVIIWQCTDDYVQLSMINPLDDDLLNLIKELYDVGSVYKSIISPDQLDHFYIEQKRAQVSSKGKTATMGGNR